ncbi:Acyl-CoA N-acyltransferase [Amanita muscaria]
MSLDEIVIRPFTSADIQLVRQLHSNVLPIRYPQSFFLQLLLLPARIGLVAYPRSDPQNLIGFISAAYSPEPPTDARIEILTLGVAPSYRHRGLARRLIRSIPQHLCALTSHSIFFQANVATSNTSALKFYEQLGFRIASDVITNLYRTTSSSKDGYLIVGCINSD